MKTLKYLSSLIFGFAAFFTATATAAPITWTFQGVLFSDGGTASGQFSTESTSGAILDWDFTTTAGSNMQGYHYDTSSSYMFGGINVFGGNPNSFVIKSQERAASLPDSNLPYYTYWDLAFTSAWTTPGTISFKTIDAYLLSGGPQYSWECNDCGGLRYVTAGVANSEGIVTSPVPEPESYAMLLAGLGLLGFMARRRIQKDA